MNSSKSIIAQGALLPLLPVLLLLPMLVGCQREIFSSDVTCPPSEGKQIIRITATVLEPEVPGTRSLLRADNIPGIIHPFDPTSKKATPFERQIASIRVLGFYAPGEEREGEIAFNKLFVDDDILARLRWQKRAGALSLTHKKPAPGVDNGVVLQFETDVVGKINIVLVANEDLDAVAEPIDPDNYLDEDSHVLMVDPRDESGGTFKEIWLDDIRTIDELRHCFLNGPFYDLFLHENGNDPNFPWSHKSYYRGAVPAISWEIGNGGLPMVGQGAITITNPEASATGDNIIVAKDIDLERVVARLEVHFSNADESGNRYPKIGDWNTYARLKGIRLNNHPMYAMLLPSERGNGDKDFATPGVTHLYHSDPSGNRFMSMYRAEEKVRTGYWFDNYGNWSYENILPQTPSGYDKVSADPTQNRVVIFDNLGNLYKASYFIFWFVSSVQDPYLKVNWQYYTRPNAIIKPDGTYSYVYWNSYYSDWYLNNDPLPKDLDYEPVVLYSLPTTSEKLPLEVPVTPSNGVSGETPAPTEVIVSTANYRADPGTAANWDLYDDYKDPNPSEYRFFLRNNDATKTNDEFAIRRNTIYDFRIVWKGQSDVYLIGDDGVKVLPWKIVDQWIDIDPEAGDEGDKDWVGKTETSVMDKTGGGQTRMGA